MQKRIAKPKKTLSGKKKDAPPQVIVMSNEEALGLENIMLKMSGLRQQFDGLQAQRKSLEKAIGDKHKVNIEGWAIDLQKRTILHPDLVPKEDSKKEPLPG